MARFVRRNWGWYFVLLDRKYFKIKLLRFHAGKSLSLQYHEHRSELWLFLRGGGSFKTNATFQTIVAGEYVIADRGVEHKYYCIHPTLAIEVQYGEKCVEEDIIRI